MASRVDDSEGTEDLSVAKFSFGGYQKGPQVVSGLAFCAIDSPWILLFLAINQYLQIAAVAILFNR